MTEVGAWMRLIENLGGTGIIGFILYKLIDKYAAAFLAEQKSATVAATNQSTSIADLVKTVRDGQNDQHEVLLVVRVLARQMEEMKEALRDGRDR